MIAEFANGYALSAEYFPDRKKPVLLITFHGQYVGHAVFKDEESKEAFDAFMVETWGERREP